MNKNAKSIRSVGERASPLEYTYPLIQCVFSPKNNLNMFRF